MIGDALLALGRRDEALRLWQEALPMIEERGDHVKAERLREKIRSVLPGTAP